MLATLLMSSIPIPANIIILRSTKPTPFSPTTALPTRTYYMIAPINFLTISSTGITRLGIRFNPARRSTIFLAISSFGSDLLAGFIPVTGGFTSVAGVMPTCRTREELLFICRCFREKCFEREMCELPPLVTICPASHFGFVHQRKLGSASNARRHNN